MVIGKVFLSCRPIIAMHQNERTITLYIVNNNIPYNHIIQINTYFLSLYLLKYLLNETIYASIFLGTILKGDISIQEENGDDRFGCELKEKFVLANNLFVSDKLL